MLNMLPLGSQSALIITCIFMVLLRTNGVKDAYLPKKIKAPAPPNDSRKPQPVFSFQDVRDL